MHLLIALAVFSATPEASAAPAEFPPHIYYESEEIFSLRPISNFEDYITINLIEVILI